MHLYLIRHGQSLVNLDDWEQGNRDEGLTELGRRQAEVTAERLARDVAVDVVYASTMRRARETAALIAEVLDIAVIHDDRIREIGNNRLDHAPWADLPRDYADYWATERPFSSVTPAVDKGESFMHFRTRIGAFIEDVLARHAGRTVLTVTHGGVIDGMFDHVFNVGPWPRVQVWTHNAAITHLEALDSGPAGGALGHAGPEQWRLHQHNCAEHLRGLEGEPIVVDRRSAVDE
jgi:probable phosphoglycerate mutase